MFVIHFSETAATDRSLHDRRANKLCSHHTCRLGGHGPGISLGRFHSSSHNINQSVAAMSFQSIKTECLQVDLVQAQMKSKGGYVHGGSEGSQL